MTILSAAMLLFLLMDPVGAVPIFVSQLRNLSNRRRLWVIVRENLVALAALLFFLFFGPSILRWLHIEPPALNIAGGLVLLIVALDMIFRGHSAKSTPGQIDEEPFIVPLAIPLIAGPATVAMIMLMVTRDPAHRIDWFLAIVAAWTAGLLILLLAGRLQHILGPRGLAAAERLMGMILVVVAVQMSLSGIEMFLESCEFTRQPSVLP